MKRKAVLSIDSLSSTIVVEDPGAAEGATREYVMKRYNVSNWSQEDKNSGLELYTKLTQWTQPPNCSVRYSLVVYNVAVQNAFLNVVCEHATQKNVLQFLGDVRARIRTPLSPAIPLVPAGCLKEWFTIVSACLCDLYDRGVAHHSDLRPTNWFIANEVEQFKATCTSDYALVKFGLPVHGSHLRQRLAHLEAKAKEQGCSVFNLEGQSWLRCLAPELRSSTFDRKDLAPFSDLWSLGYVLLSLIRIIRNADDVVEEPLLDDDASVEQWIRAVIPSSRAAPFRELFGIMMQRDPSRRTRLKQIIRTCAHFDWEALTQPANSEPRADRLSSPQLMEPTQMQPKSPRNEFVRRDDEDDPPTETSPRKTSSSDRPDEEVGDKGDARAARKPRLTIDEMRAKYKQQQHPDTATHVVVEGGASGLSPWRQRVSEQMEELEELQRRPALTSRERRPLATEPKTPNKGSVPRSRSNPKSPAASMVRPKLQSSLQQGDGTHVSQEALRVLPKHERMKVLAEADVVQQRKKDDFLKQKAEKSIMKTVERKSTEDMMKRHRSLVSSIKATPRGAVSEAINLQRQRRAHSAKARAASSVPAAVESGIEIYVKQQPWMQESTFTPSPRPAAQPNVTPASPPPSRHYSIHASSPRDDSSQPPDTPVESASPAPRRDENDEEEPPEENHQNLMTVTSPPRPRPRSPPQVLRRKSPPSSANISLTSETSAIDHNMLLLQNALRAQVSAATFAEIEATITMFSSLSASQRATTNAARMFEREIHELVDSDRAVHGSAAPAIVALSFQLGALEGVRRALAQAH